jgi:hypothetical protein
MPWWWVQDRGIDFDTLRWVAFACGLLVAAGFVLIPRRAAMALVGVVALYFVLTGAVVQNGRHGIVQASRGSLFAGIHEPHYDWVDRAVGRDADVTLVWNNGGAVQRVWENEFFNRSIRRYADTSGAETGGLPSDQLTLRPNGDIVSAAGRPATATYALASQTSYLAGKSVATDAGTGMTVVRVRNPLIQLVKVTGLYSTDTWSGRHVTYFRRRCTGGALSVQLQSDPQLYADTTQRVRSGTHAIDLAPSSRVVPFLVPLVHRADNTCVAEFTVSKVRVPADTVPGSTDARPLGVHFLHFYYLP